MRAIKLLLTIFLMGVGYCTAQQDMMMLNLEGLRQSGYVNPALGPRDGIFVGLPFLSSVSAQHSNNFLHPGGLFEQKEDNLEFQTDTYLERIDDDNRAGFELSTDIVAIGFPLKENYFSFSIREKASVDIELPGDLLRFPITGNGNFALNGGVIDLSDMNLSLNHYVEYGFGWQRSFGEQLDIGVRAKLLFGKENVRTTNNEFSWRTDPEDYTWTFDGDFDIETSGIQSQFDSLDGNSLLENGKVTKYILSSKNVGLGLDLGATYKIQDKWTLGLSLVDLGFIKYSQDVRNYSGAGANVAFAGVEITEAFISGEGSFADSLDATISNLASELTEAFALEENEASYRVGLRTRAYLNLGYEVLKKEKSHGIAGLTLYSQIDQGELLSPLATVNYTHTWNDRISVSAAYSLLNTDPKNLGLGMSVRGGPVVFYLTMDNIMWTNMTKIILPGTDGEITYPSFSQNAALHFGMSLMLKRKKADVTLAPRMD